MTTTDSPWFADRCRTCGHSFRTGDHVRVGPDGRVEHLAAELSCAATGGEDPGDSESAVAFSAGALTTWRPVGGADVIVLPANDWRVRRSPGGRRAACPVCGHTFRAGESVIVCPCAVQTPGRAPICGLAVHRDPAAGLVCWDHWQPTGRIDRCPVTFSRPAD
ncbi:hypothetical protein [Actinoplanes sp. NPDC049118]|uniref:hypothetical protein n=1 Tax=Actinoplanes sp. NPDC049118 TaxID=3155769 RepID=UPI0034115052